MKDNNCKIEFICTEKEKDCVYYRKSKTEEYCKYQSGIYCNSALAQVNRMTLEIDKRL